MMRGLTALFLVLFFLSALLGMTGMPTEWAMVLAAVAIIVWFVAVAGEGEEEQG